MRERKEQGNNGMSKEKNETMFLLRKYISRISELIRLERVILFGSGAEKDHSDGGLILIPKDFENVGSFERSLRLYFLCYDNYNKYEIDIICLTPEEFGIMKNTIGVVAEAVKEGIEIK